MDQKFEGIKMNFKTSKLNENNEYKFKKKQIIVFKK